jgi:hypothetical protein
MKILKALTVAAALVATLMPAVAGIMEDYDKGKNAALQNGLKYLSLTPQKITTNDDRISVLFRIENKFDREYLQVIWDCAAFLGAEPITQQIVIVQHIPANGRVFLRDYFRFHEKHPNADASSVKFECRMSWANDGSF